MATYDPVLLDTLETLTAVDWQGLAWRHMFNDYTPDRVNTAGARWNPPGVGAIYMALERATALAEGQHAVDIQPRRTFARRVLYQVEISVTGLVDLTQASALTAVGLSPDDVASDDHSACQRVGGAAAWLGRGGLLVPSARAGGANFVILVAASGLDDDLTIVRQEVVADHKRSQRPATG